MSYVIRCCVILLNRFMIRNCYFDIYLLKIKQRPKLMDSEKTGLIEVTRIRHRRTEWKAKK